MEHTSIDSLTHERFQNFQGAGIMELTWVDLSNAVSKQVGLPSHEAAELVRQILDGICSTLTAGGTVNLSSFGMFSVRDGGKAGRA